MGESVSYTAVDDWLYPPPDTYKWEYKYTSGSCQQDWVEGSTDSYVVFIESRPGTWDVRLTATYAQDSSGDPPHAPSVITKSVTIAPATHFTTVEGLDTATTYTSSIVLKLRVDAASRPCGPYIEYNVAQEEITNIWLVSPPFPAEYPPDIGWTPEGPIEKFHLVGNQIWDSHGNTLTQAQWDTIPSNNFVYCTCTQRLRIRYVDPCSETKYIELGSHVLDRRKWTRTIGKSSRANRRLFPVAGSNQPFLIRGFKMKRSHVVIAVFVSAVALACVGEVVLSQVTDAPIRLLKKKDHVATGPECNSEKTPRAAQNAVKLSNARDEAQITVARLLASQADPPSRAAHFASAVSTLNDVEVIFKGWHLEILNVKTVEGTPTALVRATPLVTGAGGGAAILAVALEETYEVNGGNLKLIKSEVPVNQVETSRSAEHVPKLLLTAVGERL